MEGFSRGLSQVVSGQGKREVGEIIRVCMGESEGALLSAECTNRGIDLLEAVAR